MADLSLRPAFADHYLKDYRLARANPVGKGAAARFLLDTPVFNERGEIAIVECDRPRRIVEEGRVGRVGRSRLLAIYDFIPGAGGSTRVELTTLSEPKTIVDRVRQTGIHGWMRRKTKKALERLRRIFEEPGDAELTRATVAGYEPSKAPRFGAHVPAGEEPPRPTGRLPAPWQPTASEAPSRHAPWRSWRRRGRGRVATRTRSRAWRSRPARAWRSTSAGMDYNVFLTRQLNPGSRPTRPTTRASRHRRATPCTASSSRPATPATSPGAHRHELHGGGQPGQRVRADRAAREQRVRLPARASWARTMHPRGRQRGPARPHRRSMLLFQFPLDTTENRPLELVIERALETKRIELDL